MRRKEPPKANAFRAAGNAATALVTRAHFSSVGASTAVFAALGALTAARALDQWRGLRGRAWLTGAAGLALLAALGTGERADLLAHAFGFMAGAAAGLAVAPLAIPPRSWRQAALAAGALLLVAACWARALA